MKNVYYVELSAVYGDEDKRNLERSLGVLFDSENNRTAVVDGIAWSLGRKKAFPDLYGEIGCVKIGICSIRSINNENGYCSTKQMGFYEWKVDTSQRSIEEEFEHMKLRNNKKTEGN